MHDLSEERAPADGGALQLPTDFARGRAAKAQRAWYAFELEAPGPRAGEAFAPEARLAAAFGISLYRYSGQASILVRAARLNGAGGPLWALPLRFETGEGATGAFMLAQADEFLRRRGAGGGAGAAPVGGAAPAGTGEGAAPAGSGAALTWLEGAAFDPPRALERLAAGGLDADLHLVAEVAEVAEGGGARRAAFVYDAALFRRASVERFAGHVRALLSALDERPDAPLARLPMLSAAERAWLDDVGRGRPRPRLDEPAHRLFERHAAAAPDAVAVRYRDRSLTYGELNRRANRLAHHLLSRGLGAGGRVAVCVEPSFDIAVALLGALKAGAAYVPVDPTYPTARVRTILDDTAPGLVLSRSHLVERHGLGDFDTLAFDAAGGPLDPDAPPGGGDRGDEHDPGAPVDPGQTASIYYTSGTTGRPKGVMASQANLSAYLQSARERYAIGPRDVMPAIARFSFSISMFELMSPLAAGGTLVVLDREQVLDPARLARALEGVTFFHAGPSLLKHLIPYVRAHYPNYDAFAGVRHASSGGDMIAPEVLEALKEIFAAAEVFVIYGCSEISCMGCTYPVPRGEVVGKTYVGRPFDDVTVRVLDGALAPVPAGVAGEICFAGGGVTKGYLGRPDLTAEKFVELEGRRFYRTGDLGRLSDEGWLEVLGRNDFQIKVRGMRIELGEVEHALRRAPGVRDGLVAAKAAPGGEKALVAYVVPERAGDEGERRARASALRRHLVESLPDYMVPAAYVELDALPLNHNLKVDRNALPEPEWAASREGESGGFREPETPTERRLAAIWSQLLAAPRVGLDDNFFELGGHSMLGMRLIADVGRELGVALEGMEVLRETLEVLAAACDARAGRARKASSRAPASGAGAAATPLHFGPNGSLYGVLHAGPEARATGTAALVCGPVGEENARARFVLTRLARRLASLGVPTLHFDYYGCGDSLGESAEATCGRWQRDADDARRELARRTGAARVVGVGVRLGAALLCASPAAEGLARLVLWDPVCDGAEHYAELAETHRHYLRGLQHLRLGRPPARPAGAEELLGTTYSDAALRELRALAISPGGPAGRAPLRWLVTSQAARQRERFAALCGARPDCQVEALDFDCCWNDLARLEDVLPDVGIAAALCAMVQEGT